MNLKMPKNSKFNKVHASDVSERNEIKRKPQLIEAYVLQNPQET